MPANDKPQLEPRQTYIITCIGGHCNESVSRTTSEPSKSTTTKVTTTTSKKPSPTPTPSKVSTSYYCLSPATTPFPWLLTSTLTKTLQTTIKTTTKSVDQPTKTTTEEVGPSSTRCPVPLYYKCGGWHDGKPWTGCTQCVKGAKCVEQNGMCRDLQSTASVTRLTLIRMVLPVCCRHQCLTGIMGPLWLHYTTADMVTNISKPPISQPSQFRI